MLYRGESRKADPSHVRELRGRFGMTDEKGAVRNERNVVLSLCRRRGGNVDFLVDGGEDALDGES